MAFDFGAALSSAGELTPAYQQAQENLLKKRREQQEFALSQRQKTAQVVGEEQRNKQWIPMRQYKANDGSSHTVYFTPEGLKDLMDEPDPLTQRKQYLDTLNKMGVPTTDLQKSEYLLTGTLKSTPRDRIHFGNAMPQDPNNPGGQWVQEVTDSDTGAHLYDIPAYPPSRYLGTTGTSTTYNPQFGMDITTTRATQRTLPGSNAPIGAPGYVSPASPVPMAGRGVSAPATSTPSVIQQLGQPAASPAPHPGTRSSGTPRPNISQNASGAPPILRYPAMNTAIRSNADTISSLQQQFMGAGNDPLWNYAWMMDNKPLASAINKAMVANQQIMPTGSASPGLGESIVRATPLFGMVQGGIADQIRKTRDDVQRLGGDQAVQLLDRLAELKGSIPAMRTYSKASAAQGSIAPLIQESPVLNTSSARDFTLRIAYTMRTLGAAMAADPSINPAYARWFYTQAAQAEQAGKQATKPTAKTAAEYLQENQ